MKKQTFSLLSGAVLAVALLLVSCHSSYEVTKVEGGRIPMNSVWDAEPDAEAVALLAPYKARMDSVMYHVVGTARNVDGQIPARKPFIQSDCRCTA